VVLTFTNGTSGTNRAENLYIEQSEDGGTTYSQVFVGDPNQTTVTLNNLTADTTYYWKARFSNAVGYSSYSSAVSGTTGSVPDAPNAPTNVSASGFSKKITITWDASTSDQTDGYKVYASSVTGGPYVFLADVGQNLQFTDSPIAASSTKYYRVSAYSGSIDPVQKCPQPRCRKMAVLEPYARLHLRLEQRLPS
jgi:fibronectin type 3 domain-containing protein